MKHRWIRIVGAMVLVGTVFPTLFIAQTAQTAQTEQAPGPYARIAILRALDGQTVDLEAVRNTIFCSMQHFRQLFRIYSKHFRVFCVPWFKGV